MTGALVVLLLLAVVYGVILSAVARCSVWWPVGIYAVTMAVLILCNCFSVGYVGGSDAMGNGMERGFLALFYYAAMIFTSIAFAASFVWWYFRYMRRAA